MFRRTVFMVSLLFICSILMAGLDARPDRKDLYKKFQKFIRGTVQIHCGSSKAFEALDMTEADIKASAYRKNCSSIAKKVFAKSGCTGSLQGSNSGVVPDSKQKTSWVFKGVYTFSARNCGTSERAGKDCPGGWKIVWRNADVGARYIYDKPKFSQNVICIKK